MAKKAKKDEKKLSTTDISKHEFVSKHSKINDLEAEKLLIKYNISKKQLPKILKNDPAIQDYNLENGDIVKIIRKSPTAGESTYYRVVING